MNKVISFLNIFILAKNKKIKLKLIKKIKNKFFINNFKLIN